ncbi:MAG: hypothetical protein HC842_01210 [Cytophagales bacterium]|nr:hypothetical protein [Cytophagales bacterium]
MQGRSITGTIEVRNVNLNSSGNLTFTRKVTGYTITFPGGRTVTINGEVTRELIEGAGDGILSNNVYSITGNYTATSSRGRSYTYTITEPVIANFNCRADGQMLRTQGVITITRQMLRRTMTKTVNFGTGSCDNSYEVTVEGERYASSASQE